MQEQNDLNPAERELEAVLKSLTAKPGRIDTVSAAFAAGERSAWRRARVVHSAVAAALVLCVALWNGFTNRPRPAPHNTSVQLISSTPAPADQSIVMMRRAVLENGLDGLPAASVPAGRAVRMNEIF
jgi:hypothetical protein